MKKENPFNHPFFTDNKRYVRRKMIIHFSSLFILISVALSMCYIGMIDANKIVENRKALLGLRAVIGKDTLTIIDYSTWRDTYTLSNGVEYNMDFIKTKVIEK